MAFPVIGGTQESGYEIDNSLRFNKPDSQKLSFTQGTPTSRRAWTYSTWVKRGNLQDQQESILSWGSTDFFDIRFQDGTPDDGLMVYISDTDSKSLATNRLFRDPSAWYHIVIASDTTQSTAGDRTRIYVNGVEETSFASESQPAQNYDYRGLTSGAPIVIGNRYTGSHYFDGYLADTHFIDGQQLAPTEFGETNDNGVWIPKNYTGSYGTNGFKLEFKQLGTAADATSIGADTSGNDNHFSQTNVTPAVDRTEDTPTNNFLTMNPLYTNSRGTFAEGNCKITTNVQGVTAYGQVEFGNFYVNTGKWYYEVKIDSIGSGGLLAVGFNERSESGIYINGHNNLGSSGNNYYGSNGELRDGTATPVTSGVNTFTTGDIIGYALDLDNNKFYASKNGTYQASGDPSAGTNGIDVTDDFNGYYTPWVSKDDTTNNATVSFNFGNPSFSISSGNSDANGYGNFEYAVPSGYYSLCSKNLAEYG